MDASLLSIIQYNLDQSQHKCPLGSLIHLLLCKLHNYTELAGCSVETRVVFAMFNSLWEATRWMWPGVREIKRKRTTEIVTNYPDGSVV